MFRITIGLLSILSCMLAIAYPAYAGKYYKEPQYAALKSVDRKNRTILVRNDMYKLRIGVKVHDPVERLPGISSLKTGQQIKFKTRKNPTSGQVEISEIWVMHE